MGMGEGHDRNRLTLINNLHERKGVLSNQHPTGEVESSNIINKVRTLERSGES
jgi:hypothetical protein